jgi:hypothetical protein
VLRVLLLLLLLLLLLRYRGALVFAVSMSRLIAMIQVEFSSQS